jgi:hypothetical protein
MGEAISVSRAEAMARGRDTQAARRAVNAEAVLAAVVDRPGSTRAEVAEAAGVHEITAYKILKNLIAEGRVRRVSMARLHVNGVRPYGYQAVDHAAPFRRGEGVPFHLPAYLTEPERAVLDAHDWSTPTTAAELCRRTGLPRLSVLRACRMLEMSDVLQCAGDLWALTPVEAQPDGPGPGDPTPDEIADAVAWMRPEKDEWHRAAVDVRAEPRPGIRLVKAASLGIDVGHESVLDFTTGEPMAPFGRLDFRRGTA